MLPFLHARLQQVEQLLRCASDVLGKYNRFDLDLAPALTRFLDEAIAAYHETNQLGPENELLSLKSQFVAAEEGTNPLTLERVTSRRREMRRSIALHVLQKSTQMLRAEQEGIARKLLQAAQELRPIALFAIQKGLVSRDRLDQVTIEQTGAIWRALLEQPEIELVARQLAMQFSVMDIQLVLTDLFAAARAAPANV